VSAESIGQPAFLGVAWPRDGKPILPGAAGSTLEQNWAKTLPRKAGWSIGGVEIGEAKRKFRMKIPQSVRELIAKAPLAHLTTLNSNGSPQVTVVWIGIESEEFVIGHLATHQKVRNIRRDGRVALSLLGDQTNAQGLREYLVIYGNARVTEGGAVDLLKRLAPIYLGPNADFPPAAMRNIPGYITRITPARFAGIGPWASQAAE
jgi:PPOX class probable F420-dependent enzyme